MRKFKVNKKFQALPSDAGDEFYPNGIFVFNITKLLAFINANQNEFQVEELEVKALRRFPSSTMNESTIKHADLLLPIILAELSPDQYNVIDGHHRLEKAYREGINTIFAYRVLAEQHIVFLTSTEAYTEYVQYWNSKLRMREKENALRKVSLS